jgi:biotin carboxyl carrier protein
MAALTRRVRVGPVLASTLAGDAALMIDLDAADRPRVEPSGSGAVVVRPGREPGSTSDEGIRAAISTPSRSTSGSWAVEVVVDGWRFELEVEDAARAELRRRATRVADATAASGPTEIRAIIPGRVAAVRVVAGDAVEAGQSLLVVEAMKMQNELRSPRAGTVARVSVGEGQTIDNGDLLVVLG